MAMSFIYDLHWVAGIIEGEGTIGSPKPGVIRISVTMTDQDIIDKLVSVTGVGRKYGPYEKADRKPQFQWVVAKNRDAAALAMTLFPLMGERRREQIKLALASWRSSTVSTDIVHGTSSGYSKERRRGYDNCSECYDAKSIENAEIHARGVK